MNRNRTAGLVVAAFGVGMLLSCCFPEKFVVFAVSILLVAAGFCLCKI